MYRLFVWLLCMAGMGVTAQTVITNTLTEAHQYIPLTKVCLIPPPGFTISDDFEGLEDENTRAEVTVISQLPPKAGLNDSTLLSMLQNKRMQFETVQPYTINGVQAWLATGIMHLLFSDDSVYVLVLSSPDEIQLLQADFAVEDTLLGPLLRQCLLSVVYQPERRIDPFSKCFYSLNLDSTGYRLLDTKAGLLIFTLAGQVGDTAKPDDVLMLGTMLPYDTTFSDEEDLLIQAEKVLRKRPYNMKQIDSTGIVNLNSVKGYAVYGTVVSEVTGQPIPQYGVVIYGPHMYVLLGTAATAYNLNVLKQAFATFTLKQ